MTARPESGPSKIHDVSAGIQPAAMGRSASVLLLATSEWVSTARLALAFQEVGCRVELFGSRSHPALLTGSIAKHFGYSALRPVASLRQALSASEADTIVAVDEPVLLLLEHLAAAEPAGSVFQLRLERSLGGVGVLAASRSRVGLYKAAVALGVAAPATRQLDSEADVAEAVAAFGLPLVLKADATSGGRGVKVVQEAAGVGGAWRRLRGPLSLPRMLARVVRFGERDLIRRWYRGEVRCVSAQRFVAGPERTAMAVAVNGRLVSHVCFDVLKNWCERGPSSVLRVIEDAAMVTAMEGICGSLGVTGLCGFDFMVDAKTGTPLLIELNPRPTQLAHLPLGPGRDLVAAYARAVMGAGGIHDRPAATRNDVVALFPQELQRDPQSALLAEAFHDVPWGAPKLIRRALDVVPPIVADDARWDERGA